MNGIVAELIKVLPGILWVALAAAIVVRYRQGIDELIVRLTQFGSIEALGVKFTCAAEALDQALELAEKSPQWRIEVSPLNKRRALHRARRHHAVFRGAQFLWVDDHPQNNVNERRMFRQLGVDIDSVIDNEAALASMDSARYDLILTDVARDNQSTNGLDLLKEVYQRKIDVPVIVYVGVFQPERGVPGYAFGIAHAPDELLHLSLDALERTQDH